MPGWIGYWCRGINKSQMVNNDALTQALMNMPPYRDGTSQSQTVCDYKKLKLIFKKEHREIQFNDDYTMKELCDQINNIPNSNLYSTLNNDRITVNKKYFSDFFPFNFGHLGSMTIHAKSIEIESESENLEFIIEMNDLVKFSTYGGIIILAAFAFFALINLQFMIGFTVIIFTGIAIVWSNIIHKSGISNFTKNWDEHIGTKI
jgi:hypothetical protein